MRSSLSGRSFLITGGLAARGHQVRVLTGFPNYPEGRIHPGYRQRWAERSTEDGVTLRRVLYVYHPPNRTLSRHQSEEIAS